MAEPEKRLNLRDQEMVHKPRFFRVLIHNDDFTPVEFVLQVVTQIFRKSPEDSARITLEVHTAGSAVVGVYTHEIAETMRLRAESAARRNEFPLMLSMEPDV